MRHLFDIPPEVAYLNCAYMSPLPLAGAEAGRQGIARKARPWTTQAGDFFSESLEARRVFAALAGSEARNIAIVPSASYGLAVAARNLALKRNGEILLLADEFPSNFYVWQRLARDRGLRLRLLPWPEPGPGGADWTSAVLSAIEDQTALLSLPHCHWTNGAALDLVAIAERARAVGAALTLDLTQSLGAMPIDLGVIRPDFAVAAGYKWLFGPYGLAYLHVDPKHHGGVPIEENWITRAGAEDFARLVDYQEDYAEGAVRFDMGERSSFQLMPIALEGMRLVAHLGVEAIAEAIGAKTERLGRAARALGLTVAEPPLRARHYLGIGFPRGMPARLGEILRAGNIFVSVRGSSLRVTPHVYNTEDDLERFIAALGAAC